MEKIDNLVDRQEDKMRDMIDSMDTLECQARSVLSSHTAAPHPGAPGAAASNVNNSAAMDSHSGHSYTSRTSGSHRPEMRIKKSPPTFPGGSAEEFEGFISQFKMYSEWAGLEKSESLQLFSISLEGNARKMLSRMDKDICDLDAVIKLMESEYGPRVPATYRT